ncbi:VOC family protein [Bauldia sp.]|uniref:VOC family protein n=1 Tax=Bauldia sp. TaxID=2575872 RepID=UPI003BAB2778
MRLYGVRIFVDDFAKARSFYRDTLGLKENWAMEDANAAGYDVGSAELIVEQEDPSGREGSLVGRFVGVSLQVDDIDATYRWLSDKGVSLQGPPEKQFWGGSLAHFEDPAGNVLTLVG